jgi:SPP1 gp7 family putative phage head morphogenesis protein
VNVLARRNRHRLRVHRALELAPHHAVGIENRIVSLLFRRHQVHAEAIKKRALELGRAGLRADERKRVPEMPAHLAREIHLEAKRAAEDVRTKVARALGVKPKDFDVDLNSHVSRLSDRVMQLQIDYEAQGARRARETLREWQELGERSPRYQDPDALERMLTEASEAVESKLAQSTRDAFGQSWAEMNQDAQRQAGVEQYAWKCTVDKATRPKHLELNGETCDWDDPPLKAEDSDNGDDCHAGEDFGCRCVASPLPPS